MLSDEAIVRDLPSPSKALGLERCHPVERNKGGVLVFSAVLEQGDKTVARYSGLFCQRHAQKTSSAASASREHEVTMCMDADPLRCTKSSTLYGCSCSQHREEKATRSSTEAADHHVRETKNKAMLFAAKRDCVKNSSPTRHDLQTQLAWTLAHITVDTSLHRNFLILRFVYRRFRVSLDEASERVIFKIIPLGSSLF